MNTTFNSSYPDRGEISVHCGDNTLYIGKWRDDTHVRVQDYAYRTSQPIRVKSVKTGRLLFEVKPWGRDT